jgi:hypothetical protein
MLDLINEEVLRTLIRQIVREELTELARMKEEYTEAQFCKLVGISRTTAHRMRQRGKLNYILVGCRIRYTLQHIQAFKMRGE